MATTVSNQYPTSAPSGTVTGLPQGNLDNAPDAAVAPILATDTSDDINAFASSLKGLVNSSGSFLDKTVAFLAFKEMYRLFLAQTQGDAANNFAEMNDATMTLFKEACDAAEANAKAMADQIAKASNMSLGQRISSIFSGIVSAIGAVLVGQPAMAVASVIVMVMQQTGQMDKAVEAISSVFEAMGLPPEAAKVMADLTIAIVIAVVSKSISGGSALTQLGKAAAMTSLFQDAATGILKAIPGVSENAANTWGAIVGSVIAMGVGSKAMNADAAAQGGWLARVVANVPASIHMGLKGTEFASTLVGAVFGVLLGTTKMAQGKLQEAGGKINGDVTNSKGLTEFVGQVMQAFQTAYANYQQRLADAQASEPRLYLKAYEVVA